MEHSDIRLGDRFEEVRAQLERHLMRSGDKVEAGPLLAAMRAAGVLPAAAAPSLPAPSVDADNCWPPSFPG